LKVKIEAEPMLYLMMTMPEPPDAPAAPSLNAGDE
jgi:hypothetical protein